MEKQKVLPHLTLAGQKKTFLIIIYKQTPQYLTLYKAENPC